MTSVSPIPAILIAAHEDAARLARVFEIFEAQEVSTEQVITRLDAVQGLETAFLADIGGRIVGLACVRITPSLSGPTPYVQISELYVEKTHRDEDIERRLLSRVEALSHQRGARQLTLLTGLKNNTAQGLYRALGYRGYALAMRKHLNG